MPIAPAPKEKVFPGLPQNYIPRPKRRPLVLCLLPEIIIFVASRKRHKKSPVANTPKGRYVGAPEGNRTPDPSLKRRLLCLLSYGRIFRTLHLLPQLQGTSRLSGPPSSQKIPLSGWRSQWDLNPRPDISGYRISRPTP